MSRATFTVPITTRCYPLSASAGVAAAVSRRRCRRLTCCSSLRHPFGLVTYDAVTFWRASFAASNCRRRRTAVAQDMTTFALEAFARAYARARAEQSTPPSQDGMLLLLAPIL